MDFHLCNIKAPSDACDGLALIDDGAGSKDCRFGGAPDCTPVMVHTLLKYPESQSIVLALLLDKGRKQVWADHG